MKLPLEISIIVINAVLCICLRVRRINKSYPRFYSYTLFQLSAAVTSLAVYLAVDGWIYAITYYSLIFCGNIMATLVAIELAGKLFGPSGALPSWVTFRLICWIGIGFAAALTAAGLLLRSSYGVQWGRILVSTEQWMAGILWVTFSTILIFWRTLKVFRRQTRAASICLGFVLYFTVSIFAVFIRGHRALTFAIEGAAVAGMVSYLMMMAWWTAAILMPAPVFEKSTSEQKSYILDEFLQTQKAAVRAALVSE